MKAMVLLALILLPLAMQADVIIPENEKQSRPPRQEPVKPDTTATAPTTVATTTAGTTAATTSTTIPETAAPAATQTTATQATPSPAPAPERRRSTFPFAALFTVGIALIAALTAKRRREQKVE